MSLHRCAGFFITVLLLLLGCAQPPANREATSPNPGAPAPISGPKRATVVIPGAPAVLNSIFDTSTNKSGFNELAYLYDSRLTVYDGTGTMIPMLAESVPSVENGGWRVNPDGTMETRWTIKPGVKWHDGTPYTTKDLLFFLEIERDRDIPHTIPTWVLYLDKATAIDDRTISVTWTKPFIQADQMWTAIPALPAHLLEKTYREDKESLLSHAYLTNDFVGSGPFKVTEFQPSSFVKLAAFDDFIMGRPKIDVMEVRFIVDLNTVIANVMAGQVDLTMGRGISTEQGVQLQKSWTGGKVDFADNNMIYFHAQYIDPNPPIVADVRFHRALLHAFDRPAMAETLLHGLTGAAYIPIERKHPRYQELLSKVQRHEYDPRHALQLLQELGYTRGPDGMLRNAAGQKLELEMRTTQDVPVSVATLSVMGNYLREIGMEITEVVIPTLRAGDRPYRVSFPGIEQLRGGLGEDFLVGRSICAKVPRPENGYSSGNYPRYCNPEWDRLNDRYATTIPYAERMKALEDVLVFYQEHLFEMPLFYDTQTALVSHRMIGAGAHHGGQRGTQGWNAHTWDVN